ncbi:hypothetical protein G7046_g1996 [Stylonectria norvegica]|nr:hypothetical protein G7046_g1996 [Stylonectria norvegica]
MSEDIHPSAESYHGAYVDSFKLWSRLRGQARSSPRLPPGATSINAAFPQHPSLRPDARISHVQYRKHSRSYVGGLSEWGSSPSSCHNDMPSFQQRVDITISAKEPISLCVGQTHHNNNYHRDWFTLEDQNYISILVLAWAYVLSARWTELVTPESSIAYTDSQVLNAEISNGQHGSVSPTTIIVGPCSSHEARWWGAVLAPGRGWQATMTMQGDELLAPWSVSLAMDTYFNIFSQANPESSPASVQPKAASFQEAIGFIDRFCNLHNLHDQSSAALAATLLLPSLRGTSNLTLPALRIYQGEPKGSFDITPSSSKKRRLGSAEQQDDHGIPSQQDIDRLLTLSCHVRGVQSVLLAVFYEPGVPCNKSGPWLQAILDIATPLATSEPWVLSRMLMDRLPEAAPLWLGVTILGLQQKYIKQVGFGQITTDLSSAAWSGTLQSFIQEPSSNHSGGAAWISRADECRLLFLSQAEDHSRPPVCQWAPFGTTAVEDLDVEPRTHYQCHSHSLQYKGFTWDCSGDVSALDQSTLVATVNAPRHASTFASSDVAISASLPENLDHTKEFISEAATRSIFSWLRPDGYAAGEKNIWSHEWLDMPGSDEEDEDEACDNESETKSFSHVSLWLQGIEQ